MDLFWKSDSCWTIKYFSSFYGIRVYFSCSEVSTTDPYPGQEKLNIHPKFYFCMVPYFNFPICSCIFQIFSFPHVFLRNVWSISFPFCAGHMLSSFSSWRRRSRRRRTKHVASIMFGKEWKPRSSALCNIPVFPIHILLASLKPKYSQLSLLEQLSLPVMRESLTPTQNNCKLYL